MREPEFERSLIDARDSFERRIAALEADIIARPLTPGRRDPRPDQLAKLYRGRERCERLILAGYPERPATPEREEQASDE